MRLLMTPANVTLANNEPRLVSWSQPPELRPRHVVQVIDRWRYDGCWWEAHELHRDYYFLELAGGARLELFREGEDWWAARLTD